MKTVTRAVILLMAVMVVSCSEAPVEPERSGGFSADETEELLVATVPFADGVVEVRARNLSWDEALQTAVFDVFLVNGTSTAIQAPALLAVENISPDDIVFANADGQTSDGLSYKEYDAEFGPDGALEPGEESGADAFEFSVGDNRAFSVVFSLRSEVDGVIAGVVFRDDDEDGERDGSEPGVANVEVALSVTDGGGVTTYNAQTGANGSYAFGNLEAGVYTVEVVVPADGTATTATSLTVTLLEQSDGTVGSYEDADFGVQFEQPPPLVIAYDFDDGQLPNWGGNADMFVRDGVLELTATSTNWRWEIFDNTVPGSYSRGTFQYETKFPAQGSYFLTKGHTPGDNSQYTVGPQVNFQLGEVLVISQAPINTGYTYVPDVWYRVRCEFDNTLGTRGQFTLYLKRLQPDEPEAVVGTFDYDARSGRIAGMTTFGWGGQTLGLVSSVTVPLDNVVFEANQ